MLLIHPDAEDAVKFYQITFLCVDDLIRSLSRPLPVVKIVSDRIKVYIFL